MLQQHTIKPYKNSSHRRKRVGRGNSSGHGTYSGRGVKGQKQRSGGKIRAGFQGGQTPLMRQMPKLKGFKSPLQVKYQPINVEDLNKFAEGTEINMETLLAKGLIKHTNQPVKLLGNGEIKVKLQIKVAKVSRSAQEKIEKAGGNIILPPTLSPKNKDNK